MMIPYYQTYGSGAQSLVLLHSGGMAGEEWQPQIAALSKRYRLLVPDLPGHGKTLLPDDQLSIGKLAAAVIAMLDAEGIASAHICGSSMGAATAMYLSLHYPERVEKAVFYRISYQKTGGTYEQTRLMADPAYWQRFGLQGWLSKLHEPQGGVEAWRRVIERVCEALNPAHSEHSHRLEDFARLDKSVLIITGDRDPVSPLADALDLYRVIPNCGLWVMPFASHITASNTWRSEAFAEEIIRFLAREDKSS